MISYTLLSRLLGFTTETIDFCNITKPNEAPLNKIEQEMNLISESIFFLALYVTHVDEHFKSTVSLVTTPYI
jgi:hypothetical protein